ncbi:YcxB family protein [Herbivorax sp. ANBcel31]|uniref:YcxB family protein n=1 Tax=Herbivorax sp. ANBcel31 TaxID=3069754 RepID=UPI0027B6ADCC|nr:YcxB family protein [Herbivorax sp. ANBcel31]MDQ2088069.1 YcxB family protein [Herbivorax sp. ANBcel31]
MEIKFEITEEDYIKFNLYHIKNSPSQRKIYNLFKYVTPIIFAILMYFIGTRVYEPLGYYWIILSLIFVVAWFIIYPKEYKKTLIKQTEKLLREDDNSSFFGKKTMLVDENNIKIFSENSSETIHKNGIKRIKVYDDMIIIYLSAITAQIIPTRYLDDESKTKLISFNN